MAKYKMIEMNDLRKDGSKIVYPKMEYLGRTETKAIAEQIASRSTLTTADVQGALVALAQVMAEEMAKGYSVNLEGIGTFSARLGMKEGAEREEVGGDRKRNAISIEVSNINFRADKELVSTTQLKTKLERGATHYRQAITSTREQRLQLALAHIKAHGYIKVKEYATLTHLERTRAGKELREFAAENILRPQGRGAHVHYTTLSTSK